MKETGITAMYYRVSDKKQDLDRQFVMADQLRAEHGWQVEEFADYDTDGEILLEHRHGVPKSKRNTTVGKRLEERGLLERGGKQMLERLRCGGVVRIWIPELSRLGRSVYALSAAFHEIEKYPPRPVIVEGLQCNPQTLQDDPQKIVTTTVGIAMAAVEKVQIRQRTMGGRDAKSADPYRSFGGPATYGYDVERRIEGIKKVAYRVKSVEATTGNRRLPSEVDVARLYFKKIAGGATCREVSDYLNLERIPAENREQNAARRWTPSRIRNLIRNPIYKGIVLRRYEVYRDPDDPLRVAHIRRKPREKWKELRAPDLAIVTDEEWDAAQVALKRNESLAKSNTDRQYLLTGLVRCQYCERRNFVGTTIHGDTYYRCGGRGAAYDPDGHKCDAPHLRGDYLEAAVKEDVAALAIKPGPNLQAAAEQSFATPDRCFGDDIIEAEKKLAALAEERLEYDRQRARGKIDDSRYDVLLAEADSEEDQWRWILKQARLQEANARKLDIEMKQGWVKLLALRKRALAGKLTREDIRAVVQCVNVNRGSSGKPEITIVYSFQSPGQRYFPPEYYPQGPSRLPKGQTVTRSCRPRAW